MPEVPHGFGESFRYQDGKKKSLQGKMTRPTISPFDFASNKTTSNVKRYTFSSEHLGRPVIDLSPGTFRFTSIPAGDVRAKSFMECFLITIIRRSRLGQLATECQSLFLHVRDKVSKRAPSAERRHDCIVKTGPEAGQYFHVRPHISFI